MKRLLALVVPLLLTGGPALAATPSPPSGADRTPHTSPGSHRSRASNASRASRASRERQPTGKLPVSVVLNTVSPNYLGRPAQVLHLQGLVQNQSDTTYQRLAVRLRFSSRPVTSRGELEVYADNKGPDLAVGIGPAQQVPVSLQPGGQQQWSLQIQAGRMGLRTYGVYPIAVDVVNPVTGVVVGRQRTFVTYWPKGSSPQKTKVSWIWPVIDQPHRADDSTFADDGLDRMLRGGGRLADLVTAAAKSRTVSWLIDPGLLDDVQQMTAKDGYTVRGAAHKTPSAAAQTWLNALRAATAGKRVIATPYADPDVLALSRAGMGQDIKSSIDAVAPALVRAKTPMQSRSVSVPPDGLVDQQTLAALVRAGSGTIVLSSAVLPNYQAQTYTPDPVTAKKVGGKNVRLVAYDDTLYKIFDKDLSDPGAAALAQQRFLAETAVITSEQPNNPRSVVIMPPRRWSPGLTLARNVLRYSAGAPWMRAVPLSAVEAQKAGPRVFQPQKVSAGLSKRYLGQVKQLGGQIRRFTSIFQPPVSGFALGVARLESSAWSDQPRRGTIMRRTLDTELGSAAGKIRVLNGHEITLAGKSGQFPITVANGLQHGTVVVRLRAYSQNETRLHVEGPSPKQSEITLEAGHKEQVNLYMKAAANGYAYVYLQLLTSDGQPFGATQVLRVRATGYGRTALLITGISLAVLFVGVGVRVIRRRGKEAEETGV